MPHAFQHGNVKANDTRGLCNGNIKPGPDATVNLVLKLSLAFRVLMAVPSLIAVAMYLIGNTKLVAATTVPMFDLLHVLLCIGQKEINRVNEFLLAYFGGVGPSV